MEHFFPPEFYVFTKIGHLRSDAHQIQIIVGEMQM